MLRTHGGDRYGGIRRATGPSVQLIIVVPKVFTHNDRAHVLTTEITTQVNIES